MLLQEKVMYDPVTTCGKHDPVTTFLERVAGIKFRMSVCLQKTIKLISLNILSLNSSQLNIGQIVLENSCL